MARPLKEVAMRVLFSLLLLTFSAIAAEDIVFHNISDQTVSVSLGYYRNNSVSSINGDTVDQFAFQYAHGYFILKAGEKTTIPQAKKIKFGNQEIEGRLNAIRVITSAANGQMQIVHPRENLTPQYLPASTDNFAQDWFYRVDLARTNIDNQVKQWRNDNKPVNAVMYYHQDQYRFKDNQGNTYYGVGMPGTYSKTLIDDFWKNNSKALYVLKIINNTGAKRDFQLSYLGPAPGDQWKTTKDFRTADAGASVQWEADSFSVKSDPAVTSLEVQIQGRDFNGNIKRWGPPLKTTRDIRLRNGTRFVNFIFDLR